APVPPGSQHTSSDWWSAPSRSTSPCLQGARSLGAARAADTTTEVVYELSLVPSSSRSDGDCGSALVAVPVVGLPDALFERDARAPAEGRHARDVEELARRAIRLGRVPFETSAEADDTAYGFRELAYRDVPSRADVVQPFVHALLHQVHTCVGHVIDVQELAHRPARAPHDQGVVSARLRFMRLPQQGRQHVTVLKVEVVVRPVQVGWHDAQIAGAVLAVVCLAQLETGYLGDGIRLVRPLQRTGEEILLLDRLRAIARIDAARAEEHEVPHPGFVRTVNEIGLDHQVLVDEFRP